MTLFQTVFKQPGHSAVKIMVPGNAYDVANILGIDFLHDEIGRMPVRSTGILGPEMETVRLIYNLKAQSQGMFSNIHDCYQHKSIHGPILFLRYDPAEDTMAGLTEKQMSILIEYFQEDIKR
jgi:hypothetical protein